LCRESHVPYPGTERSGDGQPLEGCPEGVSGAKQTCPASGATRKRGTDTDRRNTVGERTGVSRGRSSARSNEPGVSDHLKWGALKAPEGLTPARRTELMGTTGPRRPSLRSGRPGGERLWSRRAGVRSGSPFTARHRRQRCWRVSYIGTARCGPARRVVWGPVANYHRLPDWASSSVWAPHRAQRYR